MIRDAVGVIARIAAGAVAVFLVGLWQGSPLIFVAAYGLLLAAWQAWQRLRFEHWLDNPGQNNLAGRWSQMAKRITDRLDKERHENVRAITRLSEFQELVQNFPEGIVMLQPDRDISWFNKAAADRLGLAATDIGQPVGHLLRHPEFFEHAGNSGRPLVIAAPGDRDMSLSLQFVAVGDHQVLVVSDVTAYRKSEAARHDFVANASHELRSPLTVIRGYLDALATEETLEPVWKEPVREMVRQAQRMSDLLTDLMDLSRLDRMQLRAEWHPIDMNALLTYVKNDSRQLASGACDIEMSIDTDYHLLGEHSEILSAALNLAANAVRYSGTDCKVYIGWHVDDRGGHLTVRDNGIGIPEEDIPRITERFYRVDKGRSREEGGTGLGLAIVRNTLMRHEGQLEINSKLGEGSEFICHFPASRIASAGNEILAAG